MNTKSERPIVKTESERSRIRCVKCGIDLPETEMHLSFCGLCQTHFRKDETIKALVEALERIVGDRIDEDHPDLTNGQVMGEYSVGDMRQAKAALKLAGKEGE